MLDQTAHNPVPTVYAAIELRPISNLALGPQNGVHFTLLSLKTKYPTIVEHA